jgi:hypothetical protein
LRGFVLIDSLNSGVAHLLPFFGSKR